MDGGITAHPEDLAPLAYQARVAGKLYARERCELPARIAANLYDGWRQWKWYGRFNCKGMSYQQLWEKYAGVILEDVHKNKDDLTMEDVTAKVCLKILDHSWQTNSMVDKLVNYSEVSSEEDIQQDLRRITAQLEADARNLLHPTQDECICEDGEVCPPAMLLAETQAQLLHQVILAAYPASRQVCY